MTGQTSFDPGSAGRRPWVWLLLCLLLGTARVVAAGVEPEVERAFDSKVYRSDDDGALQYRIHLPTPLVRDRGYPLVLFFHGAQQRGNDNRKQLEIGVGDLLRYLRRRGQPAIIIAPQCPGGEQWVDTPWNADQHTMPKRPSRPMRLTIDLLEETLDELPVDRQRVYVTGLSMGGFAAWDIVQRLPETFAAAIPVCGGGDTAQADTIKDVPLWAFHGERDWAVQPRRSRDMVAALREAGGEPRYTEYPGVKHDAWTPTYGNDAVWQWMFDQRNKRCSGDWRTLMRPGCW